MTQKNQAAVTFITETRRASALLQPLRLKLLERLRNPDSASGLAKHFKIPRQKINYHLRELEKEGLIELVEERRKGNCLERIVRAASRCYLVNPEALGSLALDPDYVEDRFSSSYLVAVAARAIRDLAVLRDRAEKAKKKLATLTLESEVRFPSPEAQNAFAEELANQIARLISKYHDEAAAGGRRFKILVGAYPAITRK